MSGTLYITIKGTTIHTLTVLADIVRNLTNWRFVWKFPVLNPAGYKRGKNDVRATRSHIVPIRKLIITSI